MSLPPVTPITLPTAKRDSSEARNTYADASPAGWCGSPTRAVGTELGGLFGREGHWDQRRPKGLS
jgi:hypothetical protein